MAIAGEAPGTFVNTNPAMVDSGIQDCSTILRQFGLKIPEDTSVFAATPQRAIVDLLVSHSRKGMDQSYLRLEDYFDSQKEVARLEEFVNSWTTTLPEKEKRFVIAHVNALRGERNDE